MDNSILLKEEVLFFEERNYKVFSQAPDSMLSINTAQEIGITPMLGLIYMECFKEQSPSSTDIQRVNREKSSGDSDSRVIEGN